MAISPECLSKCLESLLEKRKRLEAKIDTLAQALLPPQTDFDEGVRNELESLRLALRGMTYRELRRINIRIEEIKTGRFKGVCPSCQKDIKEDDLVDNPLMEKCADCQQKLNGKH